MDRIGFENRILTEMVSLSATSHEYPDLVYGVLDLVEQVVSSPFLSLCLYLPGRQALFHSRTGEDVHPGWAYDITRYVDAVQRNQPAHLPSTIGGPRHSQVGAPAAWLVTVPARVRSGRSCLLTLGCPRPLLLTEDEEQVMQRVVRHVLLVLDHALLSGEIEGLEMTDGLTGVASHRRLLEALEYEMRRHRFLRKRLALMLLDVDGLDGINRSYGRQYGNHILSKLAGLLQETIRPVDIPARCGMDEFAVVMPEADEDEAELLAEELRERMLRVGFAGGDIELTVGVTHVKPDEVLTAEGFLRRAEQALHVAKRQGRGLQERVIRMPRAIR